MKKFVLIILLLSGCSKKVMVSNSDLQTKMKMESEAYRIRQRDKKIFFLAIWATYAIGMSYIADHYK